MEEQGESSGTILRHSSGCVEEKKEANQDRASFHRKRDAASVEEHAVRDQSVTTETGD